MKKAYIICLFLFVGFTVYLGSYFYARTNFQSEDYYENRFIVQEDTSVPKVEPIIEAAINDQLICNLTSFVQEDYDMESGILTENKINTPVALLGYSRDKLIIYMKQYMKEPSTQDKEKGLIAFELISFSRDKVVWRKTYSRQDNVEFLGTVENGYLTIYLPDGTTLYDYTNISVEKLPSDIQHQLEQGIHFHDYEELYDFLETYTS